MTICDFNLQPVGTGPFKFVEYVAGPAAGDGSRMTTITRAGPG